MRLCGRQFYLDKCYLSLIILLIFGVVVGVRAGNLSEGLNYRNIMIPLGVQVIFIAAQLNSRISILKLDALSRNTLAIYLWHMPLIGFLNWISNQYLPGLHFFSWGVVLLIFYVVITHLSMMHNLSDRILQGLGIKRVYV